MIKWKRKKGKKEREKSIGEESGQHLVLIYIIYYYIYFHPICMVHGGKISFRKKGGGRGKNIILGGNIYPWHLNK